MKPYQKVASHEAEKGSFKKCLLLYSGGLDTSMMLKWIQDEYDSEVVALTTQFLGGRGPSGAGRDEPPLPGDQEAPPAGDLMNDDIPF